MFYAFEKEFPTIITLNEVRIFILFPHRNKVIFYIYRQNQLIKILYL